MANETAIYEEKMAKTAQKRVGKRVFDESERDRLVRQNGGKEVVNHLQILEVRVQKENLVIVLVTREHWLLLWQCPEEQTLDAAKAILDRLLHAEHLSTQQRRFKRTTAIGRHCTPPLSPASDGLPRQRRSRTRLEEDGCNRDAACATGERDGGNLLPPQSEAKE